jgi:hypothetical protein
MEKKAEKNLSHVIDVGLKGILKILKISKPSKKTNEYLDKVSSKLFDHLKTDLKKQKKKKAKAAEAKSKKAKAAPSTGTLA